MTIVCSSQTATQNEYQWHRRQSGTIEKLLTNVCVVPTKRPSGVYRHVISLNSLQFKTTPLKPTVFSTCNAHLTRSKISQTININTGRDSSVVIATAYGLDGPGMEPGGSEIFRTCPDRPRSPPRLLYNGYWVFAGGRKRSGCDADHPPPSSAAVKRV
jgi:hypothetical protein